MGVDRRALAIAAASGRVGYVLLEDMRPELWGLSRKASRGAVDASEVAANWIERIRPDLVVTEKILAGSAKGPKTRDIIAAITAVAELADVLDLQVARHQAYPSKYDEAKALAADFPELAHLLPDERKPWQSEPRTMIYFEALALALAALGDPTFER